MSKIKVNPTSQPQEIKPIDCKISSGMTRIYGIREDKQAKSQREFERLINQVTNNE
ncbi:MAG: hypothetical protein AAGJ18_22055 [Bacteroidota bacterium]